MQSANDSFHDMVGRSERADEISSTLKKALAMQGPVLVGVLVDYRDNHRLMEMVHLRALN